MSREDSGLEDESAARTNRMATPRTERDIIVVVGKTGMGKTRWTRAYLRTLHRIILVDPMAEHEGLEFQDTDAMIDHIMENRVFRVRTEAIDDFPMVCSIAYAATRCVLVVEESQRVLPSGNKELPPSFTDIIYRGRHKRTSLILISQRASTIHIAGRSQWTRLIIFNQTEPNDVAWLLNTTGFDLDPANLPQSHYYDVTPGSFQVKQLSDSTPLDNSRNDIDTVEDDEVQPTDKEGSDPEWDSETS